MEKTGKIYKITFKDGAAYIGQTTNFEARMQRYKDLDCKSQVLLYKKLRRNNGLSSTNITILGEYPASQLDEKEIGFILSHDTCFRFNKELGLNILCEKYEDYIKIKSKLPSYKPAKPVRKIEQRTIFGDLIRVWDSAYSIEKSLGIKRKLILKTVRSKNKVLYGFEWRYMDTKSN